MGVSLNKRLRELVVEAVRPTEGANTLITGTEYRDCEHYLTTSKSIHVLPIYKKQKILLKREGNLFFPLPSSPFLLSSYLYILHCTAVEHLSLTTNISRAAPTIYFVF